jgi:hypothetical protein
MAAAQLKENSLVIPGLIQEFVSVPLEEDLSNLTLINFAQ